MLSPHHDWTSTGYSQRYTGGRLCLLVSHQGGLNLFTIRKRICGLKTQNRTRALSLRPGESAQRSVCR
jgi:hypothetical protein